MYSFYNISCTTRPDKHDRVFLASCRKWLVQCTLLYTRTLDKLQGTRNTSPYITGQPVYKLTRIKWTLFGSGTPLWITLSVGLSEIINHRVKDIFLLNFCRLWTLIKLSFYIYIIYKLSTFTNSRSIIDYLWCKPLYKRLSLVLAAL